MPGILNGRKRPSTAISDDDDDEQSDASYDSIGSKRARHSRDASDSPPASVARPQNGSHGDNEYSEDVHQPSSLVRVKLTNFVTYTAAEFHLGPSLNMIIGPNGTGKSTLVCAICLGLGWSPQHLGRAKEIGEFVKHGNPDAEIEIELAAGQNQRSNPVIRRVIRKEGNKSAFFINNRSVPQKDVIALARSFSIQIDNLCQFLPQDRVVEFAQMSPESMLRETQRAAAPPHMVEWHDQLKGLRTEEKGLEVEQNNEDHHLKSLQAKQNATREDVDRYNQRQELVLRSRALEKCRPIINMKILATEVKQVRSDMRTNKQELEKYQAEVEPTRRAQLEMEEYRGQVDQVTKLRKQRFDTGKDVVEKLASKIDAEQQALGGFSAEIEVEKQAEKQRKTDIKRIEGDINRLKRARDANPADYDQAAFGSRINEFRKQASAAGLRQVEIMNKIKNIKADVLSKRSDLQTKVNARAELMSQSGQQALLLQKLSLHTHDAWNWLEKNMASLPLKDKAYPPAILSCTVPNSHHAAIVESQLRLGDLTAITCTNEHDNKIISNKLFGKPSEGGLGLHHITIRTSPQGRAFYHPPLTKDELNKFGFDNWIIDLIQGPDAVLAMLCDSTRLHRAASASRPISNEQYTALQGKGIARWVSGKEVYQVATRREYGVSSTSVTQLRAARYFTDQSIGTEDEQRVDQEISEIERDCEHLRGLHNEAKEELMSVNQAQKEAEAQRAAVQAEQEKLQKAYAEWRALPTKIATKEAELQGVQDLSADTHSRVKAIRAQSEKTSLKVAALTLEHAKAVIQLHTLHESHLEAEIRLIEADSEVDGYKSNNREILKALEQKQAELRNLENQYKTRRAEHEKIRAAAQRLVNTLTGTEKGIVQEFSSLPTMEALENEIAAVGARLEMMAEGNPGAIKAYERREQEILAAQEKLEDNAERLEAVRESIKEIREQWEPELDTLIAEISDRFSHNFQQIGCAGQVGIYKDDDFENWAIQIQVRFREGEPLQILDSHRQSGGERSVSTVFYLMALQDFARSPFRVVDEINQAMDPRNERKVHERMVDIACRERTSQYFLITPKLLNGLKYHPKMKVHCIASGEHMPDQSTNLDFQSLAKLALRVRRQGVATA